MHEWVEAFKTGRTSIRNEERSGRPSTSVTDENVGRADANIRDNWRISIEVLVKELSVNVGSA